MHSLTSGTRRKCFDKAALTVLGLVCAGLACLAPGLSGPVRAEEPGLVDRIVAVVNDEIISLFELEQLFRPYAADIRARKLPPDKEKAALSGVREQILERLIEQKLTDQEVGKAGIVVGEKEIDGAIGRFKEANFYTDEDMRRALAGEGMTMSEFRERIRNQILRSKVVNLEVKSKIVITEEEVKAYYDKNKAEYDEEKKYHLRNIMLKVPELSDEEERLEIRKKLERIRKALTKGGSFAQMAKKHSQAPSASEGGDLGTLGVGSFFPQLREAVEGMKPGQITRVLDTDWGYQIFLVEDVRDGGGKTLDEARPDIEEKLYNEIVEKKFMSWLKALRERSHIRIIR